MLFRVGVFFFLLYILNPYFATEVYGAFKTLLALWGVEGGALRSDLH